MLHTERRTTRQQRLGRNLSQAAPENSIDLHPSIQHGQPLTSVVEGFIVINLLGRPDLSGVRLNLTLTSSSPARKNDEMTGNGRRALDVWMSAP